MSTEIRIPWALPSLREQERQALIEVYDSGWLTMGDNVRLFEQSLSERVGSPEAVAVSNGSIALELALQALGLQPGDEVILPALSYFASAAAISRRGGVPVFADVDAESLNLDPAGLEAACGRRTRGLLWIDYGGNPCPIGPLMDFAEAHGLFLLLDGAQSLGAACDGKSTLSQAPLSTTSFHMAKVMTTVEGGMLFAKDPEIAHLLRSLRNQGELPGQKYVHHHMGTNARMNDLQAAIGRMQVRQLDVIHAARARVAESYSRRLREAGILQLAAGSAGNRHGNFLLTVSVRERDAVALRLREVHGIETRVAYPRPLYEQPVYTSGDWPSRHLPCPVSERRCREILNLPLHAQLGEADLDRIVSALLQESRR